MSVSYDAVYYHLRMRILYVEVEPVLLNLKFTPSEITKPPELGKILCQEEPCCIWHSILRVFKLIAYAPLGSMYVFPGDNDTLISTLLLGLSDVKPTLAPLIAPVTCNSLP